MENAPTKAEIDALIALYGAGQFAEVIAQGEPLARRHPQVAVLFNILGAANAGLKRSEAALDCFRQALRISPESAEAHNNLGNALKTVGQLDEAMSCYKRALAIQPAAPGVHNNLANGLRETGRMDEAIAGYQRALQIKPDYLEALYNLGVTLRAIGRRDETIDCCVRALRIKPDYAEVHDNLGQALKELGRHEEAIACFRNALKLKPDYAEAWCNLGGVLKDIGRRDEAIAAYRRALAIRPDYAMARAQKLHQQAHVCDWEGIATEAGLIPELGISGETIPPAVLLSLEDLPARHAARAERYGRDLYRLPRQSAFVKPTARPKRLRIGYFSADFHDHATMYLMARLFELHDRERFEIHAYSFGPEKNDAMRRRARAAFDHFHDVGAIGDRAVADLAQGHGIDIAIDLKGYTQHARLGIFANRPAPIQITYLGYPGTLGVPFIDYMIADKVVIPPDQRQHYREKLIYLPDSYQASDDQRIIADSPVSRRTAGLPERGFVFVNFNSNYKLAAEEFDIWMRLLARIDGSILWLLAANPWAEANLRRRAQSVGLSPDRLIFAPPLPQAEHLARHRLGDLFLDSFNYNAHTTATDALWVGLPVLTRPGEGFAARVAASLLRAIDAPELVAATKADYERLAFELASNPDRLGLIREKLAGNRTTTPLFDSLRFTRRLEAAFDRVHAHYRAGETPRDIELT